MRYTNLQYAQALYASLQDTNPKDYDQVIENFIAILKANGDLGAYEEIIAVYERYDKEQRGIKEVEVTAAMPTSVNKSLLNELNEIVGKNIEVKQKIDANIIGGVIIKVDDALIDGSVKRQLENLEDSLKE